MAVRARGSTGCTTISSSSATLPDVRLEFDRRRLPEFPVCVRCILRFDEAMLPRCRTDAYITSVTMSVASRLRLTARGLCSMPTLKSHSNKRQSSPTLPIR
jgi:hypothetical protein